MAVTCQLCSQRDASTHLTELAADGTRQELHVCPACITRLELRLDQDPPAIAVLLAATTAAEAIAATPKGRKADLTCSACGLTWAAYLQHNLLGCPTCYAAFAPQIDPLIRRYHSADRHRGRRAGHDAPAPDRRAELEANLAEAVRAERFEEAARCRDALRHLDGGDP